MRIKVMKRTKWVIKLPIGILGKARDLYMKTMFACAGRGYRANAMGYAFTPVPQGSNSNGFKGLTEEDINQLVRMSIRMGQSEGESSTEDDQWIRLGTLQAGGGGGGGGQGRSYSVGLGKIGRIDEEKPCEFVEVDDKIKEQVFSRSRTYAVRNKVSLLLAQ